MIRFTGYGVIAEKPRVGQLGRIFPCTCRKNYGLDHKRMSPFLMVSTSSITKQSLGKIVQRAPAVGAKMWCLFFLFVCFVFFCHAPSPDRRAFEWCIVRTHIALPFIGRFRRGLDPFFRKGSLFQTTYIVLTFVARWRHNFR